MDNHVTSVSKFVHYTKKNIFKLQKTQNPLARFVTFSPFRIYFCNIPIGCPLNTALTLR